MSMGRHKMLSSLFQTCHTHDGCVYVFLHGTLRLWPCFISCVPALFFRLINKYQSKWSDRCRHISIPYHFPEQKNRTKSPPVTSHAHADVHKEDTSSLHTSRSALEDFPSSSLFIKLILIMQGFLFDVGVFSKPWWPILPTHSVRGEAQTGWGITLV